MLAELVLQVRKAPIQFHFLTTQLGQRSRCGELGNTVDIAIRVDHVAGLLEVGALVANLFARSHELGAEVADLLLLDLGRLCVMDTALGAQFRY